MFDNIVKAVPWIALVLSVLSILCMIDELQYASSTEEKVWIVIKTMFGLGITIACAIIILYLSGMIAIFAFIVLCLMIATSIG